MVVEHTMSHSGMLVCLGIAVWAGLWAEMTPAAPVLRITSPERVLTDAYPLVVNVTGTNNAEIAGSIMASNTLCTGIFTAQIVSTHTWIVTNAPIATGTNCIYVWATNVIGVTAGDSTTVVRVDLAPPYVYPQLTMLNSTTASLDWGNYAAPQDILLYRIYYRLNAAFTDLVQATQYGGELPATTTNASGNTYGQSLYVVVVAVDRAGNYHRDVPYAVRIPPGPPFDVTGVNCVSGRSNLLVRWTPPYDPYSLRQGYDIYVDNRPTMMGLPAAAISCLLTNLMPATGYWVRIANYDSVGTNSGSAVLGATLLANPTIVTAMAGHAAVTLQWNAAQPALYVKEYALYCAATPFSSCSGMTARVIAAAGATNATITNLVNNLTYYCAVATVNISGGTEPLVTNIAVIPRADMDGPAVSNVCYNGVRIVDGFTNTYPGVVSVAAYDRSRVGRVEFYVDDTRIGYDASGGPTFSSLWNMTTLADGLHTLEVRAYDSLDNLTAVRHTVYVQLGVPPTPVIVAPVSGTCQNDVYVQVSGTADPYVNSIQWYTNDVALGAPVAITMPGTFARTLELGDGAHTIQAAAVNRVGEGARATTLVMIDRAIPSPPQGIEAQAQPGGSINLSWWRPAQGRIGGYNIFRGTAPFTHQTEAEKLNSALVTATSFHDLPATNGSYYYRLTAVNYVGTESALSAPVSAVSDRTAPTATVQLDSTGVVTNGRYAPGTVTLTLTASEPLLTPPYVGIARIGAAPIVVGINPASELVYTGALVIAQTTAAGAAFVTFTGRDMVGNSGTEVAGDAAFTIDTTGPAATLALDHAAPLRNEATNPVTLTATFTCDPLDLPVGTPQAWYALSMTQTNATPLTLTQTLPHAWRAAFTLPATAGTPNELLQFTWRAQDDVGNLGGQLSGDVTLQVYQGALPPLAPPAEVTAQACPAARVALAWRAVSNAAGYVVYRQAPGEGGLTPLHVTIGQTNHIDTTAEGTNQYAVASLRQANGQISTSAYCAPVSVRADGTAPPAPARPALFLAAHGMALAWSPGVVSEPIVFDAYRAAAAFTTVSNATLIMGSVAGTNAVDTTPLMGLAYYAVVARDDAGNVSALSPVAATNIALTPVSALTVTRYAGDLPQIDWTHAHRGALAGFNVYAGEEHDELPLNATLLDATAATFEDCVFTPTNRRYSVAAVALEGSNACESIRRAVALPLATVEPASNTLLQRGSMNLLRYTVRNDAPVAWPTAVLEVYVAGQRHASDACSLPGNGVRVVDVVVPGYTNLPDDVLTTNQLVLTAAGGEHAVLGSTCTMAVGDAMLHVALQNEPFVKGMLCTARVVIVNNTEVGIEAVLAQGHGAQASPEARVLLQHEDGGVLAVTALKQATGLQVFTLRDGTSVLRLAPGAEFVSAPIALAVPAAAPDSVRLRVELDKLHYHYGEENHVALAGVTAVRALSLVAPPYVAAVTNLAPVESYGTEPVNIAGVAIEPASGAGMAYVPVTLVLGISGFERTFTVYTDSAGNWTYEYRAPLEEQGVYHVYAAHPSVRDRAEQGQFRIRRVTVTPARARITAPRNFSYVQTFHVQVCAGLALTNLHLAYREEDQLGGAFPEGVTVTPDLPVPLAAGEGTYRLDCTVRASNSAMPSPIVVLRVASDGPAPGLWANVPVACSFLDGSAAPALVCTPSVIETGVAPSNSVVEEVTVANRGFLPLVNVQAALTDTNDVPLPRTAWVTLGSVGAPGDLAAGAQRTVALTFAPDASVPVSALAPYEFRLQFTANDYPTSSVPVYVYVDNSGRGNVLFHIDDIYSGTLDASSNMIRGVAGARIRLSKEIGLPCVTNVVTDANGDVYVQGLPTGPYTVRISASKHNEAGEHVWIRPAATVVKDVFLPNELITFEWRVDEITLRDVYNIVLNITYETDVPAAVVVIDPPSISVPDMQPGEVYQGELLVKNYGLIRADNVRAAFPRGNQWYSYDFLATVPTELAAHEVVRIPYRITCLKRFGEASQTGGGCVTMLDCVSISYEFVCANGYRYSGSARSCIAKAYGDCDSGSGGGAWFWPSGDWHGGISNDGAAHDPCDPDMDPDEPWCDDCLKDLWEWLKDIWFVVGCEVNCLRGEYTDSAADISCAAAGGKISFSRRYYGDAWHWEHARNNLIFSDAAGQVMTTGSGKKAAAAAIASISHGRVKYTKAYAGNGMYVFTHNNYSIVTTPTGYRWTTGDGAWEEFTSQGRLVAKGRHTRTLQRFVYEGANVTGIFDGRSNQIYWLTYGTDGRLARVRDYDNRTVAYSYDHTGRLTNVVDALGQQTVYEYDTKGHLVKSVDTGGRPTLVRYDGAARVSSVLDQHGVGNHFSYSYDAATQERYTRIRNTSGRIKEVWYNSAGETRRVDVNGKTIMSIRKDGNTYYIADDVGKVTRRVMDANGNMLETMHPDGSTVRIQYHPALKIPVQFTDARGVRTLYAYTSAGDMTSVVEAVGTACQRMTLQEYDDQGVITKMQTLDVTGALVRVTTFSNDWHGNMIARIDPDGHTTHFQGYDAAGNPAVATNPRGTPAYFVHDRRGRLAAFSNALGVAALFLYDGANNLTNLVLDDQRMVSFEYDDHNRCTRMIDAAGTSALLAYDTDGHLVASTDRQGVVRHYEYDLCGRMVYASSTAGMIMRMHYDDGADAITPYTLPTRIDVPGFSRVLAYDIMNRPVVVTDVAGAVTNAHTRLKYDAAGTVVAKITDGCTNSMVYDAHRRLTRATDPLDHATLYEYDIVGNLVAETDVRGQTTRYRYDPAGRRVAVVRPSGATARYAYDAAGGCTNSTAPDGRQVAYDLDAVGRPCKAIYLETNGPARAVTYLFNRLDQLTFCDDGVMAVSNVFDPLGRRICQTVDYGAFSLSCSSEYSAAGLLTARTGPNGIRYEYLYDQANRFAGIIIPGVGRITVTRHHYHVPAAETVPGGLSANRQYDAFFRQVSSAVHDAQNQARWSASYQYSSKDLLISQTCNGPQSQFVYDALARLTGVTAADGRTVAYTYDPLGNVTHRDTENGTWVYGPDSEFISNATMTCAYDANGNMTRRITADNTNSFAYDPSGRLIAVYDHQHVLTAAYYYDPLGRRTRKITGDATNYYFYSDDGLIGEYDANGRETCSYGLKPFAPWMTDPLFIRTSGLYYYCINDMRGAPQTIVNQAGETVWAGVYTVEGACSVTVARMVNNLRLPGQYFDAETGLHFNRNRYYDPAIGRYITRDPLGIDANPYLYAAANPFLFVDPDGLCAVQILSGGIESLFGFSLALGSGGLGIIPGVLVGLHGADVAAAGVVDLIEFFNTHDRESHDTLTSQGMQALGVQRDAANVIDGIISMAGSFYAGNFFPTKGGVTGIGRMTQNADDIANFGPHKGLEYKGPCLQNIVHWGNDPRRGGHIAFGNTLNPIKDSPYKIAGDFHIYSRLLGNGTDGTPPLLKFFWTSRNKWEWIVIP
jgi:RHS repeat-associated protein